MAKTRLTMRAADASPHDAQKTVIKARAANANR